MRNYVSLLVGVLVCVVTPSRVLSQTEFEVRFEKGLHEALTREVLRRYVQAGTISPADADRVIRANLGQDDHQSHNEYHFDNCNFSSSVTFINNRWAEINRIGNRRSGASLDALGKILHGTQDFYAHSTWVEMKAGTAPVPLWNFATATLPAGIVTGTWLLGDRRCPSGTPSHGTLNKDSSTSQRGASRPTTGPNRNTTYFDLAFGCALRSSREHVTRYFGFLVADEKPGGVAVNQAAGEGRTVDEALDAAVAALKAKLGAGYVVVNDVSISGEFGGFAKAHRVRVTVSGNGPVRE